MYAYIHKLVLVHFTSHLSPELFIKAVISSAMYGFTGDGSVLKKGQFGLLCRWLYSALNVLWCHVNKPCLKQRDAPEIFISANWNPSEALVIHTNWYDQKLVASTRSGILTNWNPHNLYKNKVASTQSRTQKLVLPQTGASGFFLACENIGLSIDELFPARTSV